MPCQQSQQTCHSLSGAHKGGGVSIAWELAGGRAHPENANKGAPLLVRRAALPVVSVRASIVRRLGRLPVARSALPGGGRQLLHSSLHPC